MSETKDNQSEDVTLLSEVIRVPPRELSSAAVDAKPIGFDFSMGCGEQWDIIVPATTHWSFNQCRSWLHVRTMITLPSMTGLEELGEDGKSELLNEMRDLVHDHIEAYPDEYYPMMNYIYPLPDYTDHSRFIDQIVVTTAGSCLLVEVEGKIYLALAGGGMDLSWDICEAYMLVGYLPPFHFCDLPYFGGLTLCEKTQWILEGCIRSSEIIKGRAQGIGEKLSRYMSKLNDDIENSNQCAQIASFDSRQKAINDGVIIEVSEPAEKAGHTYPFAVTRAVYENYVAGSPEDEDDRYWFILWNLRCHIVNTRPTESEILYEVLGLEQCGGPQSLKLKAIEYLGEDGTPEVLLMLPDEDSNLVPFCRSKAHSGYD